MKIKNVLIGFCIMLQVVGLCGLLYGIGLRLWVLHEMKKLTPEQQALLLEKMK